MRKLIFLFLLFASAALSQDGTPPRVIPIQNPSFENASLTPVPAPPGSNLTDCGSLSGGNPVPGWQLSGGGAYVLQPNLQFPSTISPCRYWRIVPPDGANVMVAGYSGAGFSQDTGVTPQSLQGPGEGGFYTMRFWVASYFGKYPGYYEAAISFVGSTGTLELCSTDGWAKWHFSEVTLVCPSVEYLVYDQLLLDGSAPPVDPNAHVVISFSSPQGWPVLFDDISLSFRTTPN